MTLVKIDRERATGRWYGVGFNAIEALNNGLVDSYPNAVREWQLSGGHIYTFPFDVLLVDVRDITPNTSNKALV